MGVINIGPVGGGQIAKPHVLAYRALPVLYAPRFEQVNLALIGEASKGLARTAAKNFGIPNWVVGWKNVTSARDINLVDIVTPVFIHKEPAIDAIDHGKNVFCEKPLAANSREALEMFQAAKRSSVKHMVGFNHRRLPAVAFAKKLIDEHFAGKIYQMRSFYYEDFGAGPNTPLTWRFKSAAGGSGAVMDMGTHVIDIFRFF